MKRTLSVLFFCWICAGAYAQTFTFECFGGYLTTADANCDICNTQVQSRLFNGLLVRRNGVVTAWIDCPYIIRVQGNNLVFQEIIPNPQSITVALVGTGYSTLTGFKDSTACMCARQDSSWIGGGGSGDPSITNEGILGVGAGASNTSVITSNTSTAVGVTVSGSTTVLVTESTSSNGGTITLQGDTSLLATVNDINAINCRWCSVKHAMPFYSNNPQTAFEALRTYWASRLGEIVVDTSVSLTANTTIAGSIRFSGGGYLTVDTLHTVTFSNAVAAEPKHFVFRGAGDYDFNSKSVAVLYPYWFGALGNNSADDYQEIQKTVDCAIRNKIGVVKLLSGYHLISKGILIRNGANTVTLNIEGNTDYDADYGTNIVSTDSTNFVIGIQGARSCMVRNMYLRGKGSSYNPTPTQIIQNTRAQWRAQWGRDDRYSPFSGIVIDPFKTTAPTGGGYPGFSDQYSNTHATSSAVIIENVVIRYFPVGIMISPSGNNNNGAEVTVRSCTVDRCEYGVAGGSTQSRDVDLVNTNISTVAACMDGLTFGGQAAPMPIVIGGQLSACKDMLRYSSARGDGKIVGTYSESVYRIGKWTGNSGAPLNFNNCEINLITSAETGLPDAASVLDAAGCTVVFSGGSLRYSSQRPVEMNVRALSLRGVHLNRPILNNPSGNSKEARISYDGCQITGYNSLYSNSLIEKDIQGQDYQRSYGNLIVPGQRISYYEGGTLFQNTAVFTVDNDAEDHTLQIEGNVTITVDTTARTATFTATNPERYRVGDILFAYNNASTATPSGTSKACSWGIVSNISGTTITCNNIPSGLTSGTYAPYLWKETIFTGTFIGNITSGSNKVVITSKNTHGPSLASVWPVGTRVYSKANQAYNFGLYAGLYVTSVTADTLFLSGNCGATVTGMELMSGDPRCTYYSADNTYQASGSTYRNVGYQTGDEIVFSSHAYRARAIVTAGGFTPTVKFIFKPLSGLASAKPTPTSLDAGLTYFSTDTPSLEVWNGTAWVAMDGSATNEAWTVDADDADTELITTQTIKFQGGGINTTDYNPATDVVLITGTEVDGSVTNEIQTISASGTGPTSYNVDLSLSGGSVTLAEGAGIDLTRSTNTITIASTITQGPTGSGVANQVTYWTGTNTIGGDTDWTFDGLNSVLGGTLKANDQNANKAIIGAAVSGSPQYPGLWLTPNTPSFTNYAILADVGATATLLNAPTSGNIQLKIANGEVAKVTATGVGIGGVTPVNKLDVEGGAVIGATYSGTNTGPTNGLLVEGSIGIGNTSPSQKAHITGSIRVTGGYYDSNNDPGTSGQVLSSTVTGTDWITGGTGTLTAAENGIYVSGTTVRMGTNPLIEATLIDQDANDMRFYDGKWSYSSRSISWTPTQGMGIQGLEASPTTNSTPTQDGIIEFSVTNSSNSLQSNSLTIGAYATDADGVWIQARSNSVPNASYPLQVQPRGGKFSVGRVTPTSAKATFAAVALPGSTAAGSVVHWESTEGNKKAAATFGVGTDVVDGEVAYFDSLDITRITNRNTNTGTSSFRIAVGGETSDRVTVVASSVTPSARMGIGTTAPTSTLQSAGSFSRPAITTTAATTLDERHSMVVFTGSTGVTFTLPTASGVSGREYIIAHNGSAGTLTLSTTVTKGNASTFNTLTAGQWAWIKSDGTIWRGFKVASL